MFLFILQEILSRSSAETRQLELLSDLSSVKLRYAAVEKDNMELRGQLKRSEQDMITLVNQVFISLPFQTRIHDLFTLSLCFCFLPD